LLRESLAQFPAWSLTESTGVPCTAAVGAGLSSRVGLRKLCCGRPSATWSIWSRKKAAVRNRTPATEATETRRRGWFISHRGPVGEIRPILQHHFFCSSSRRQRSSSDAQGFEPTKQKLKGQELRANGRSSHITGGAEIPMIARQSIKARRTTAAV